MKIKLLVNGPVYDNVLPINPLLFYLKHFYSLVGKFNHIVSWQPCTYFMVDNVDTQVSKIMDDPPDILGLSIFCWNEEFQLAIARKIKQHLPSCIIVLGGPQLTAHKNQDFFNDHPYVNFVVYGHGEEAFTQIIDHQLSRATPEFVNTVTLINGQYRVFPYKIVLDDRYISSSPFLNQKETLTSEISRISDSGLDPKKFQLVVEFSRGCMYSCSFCDWGQGLSNKVIRKHPPWKEELHLFKDLDLQIRDSDANFGQWPEDIEIFDYAASLYDRTKNFKFVPRNTPKLKKDVAFYLITKNAVLFNEPPRISLQDINPNVLTLINRPEIPWEKHTRYIRELKKNINPRLPVIAELIVGLPGQSRESIKETIKTLADVGFTNIQCNIWELLRNSPANAVDYKKTHNIVVQKTFRLTSPITSTLKDVYTSCNSLNYNPRVLQELNVTLSANTLSIEDIIYATLLSALFNQKKNMDFQNLDALTCKLTSVFISRHRPLVDEFGFYVLCLPVRGFLTPLHKIKTS